MSIEVPIIILILAIPTYFLCKWVMKSLKIGNTQNRKFIAIIPTVIFSPLIYVGLVLVWFSIASYYPSERFDKSTWDTAVEERYTMSQNIIDSNLLTGKTKDEVTALLGEDFVRYNDEHIGYYIGFIPAIFNIDPSYLHIYFENGRVVKVSQEQNQKQ